MTLNRTRLSISQALFTVCFAAFVLTLLNGYVLNLITGYQADPWLVLAGVILEFALLFAAGRSRIAVERDVFELAGFCAVVLGVWLYFVIASLPTFLPPTYSMDAVRHYLQALFSYPKGTLVSWYPAGGAFLAAMVSNWTGVPPLRVLHPVAASFVALSAGGVYGIACGLLPPQRSRPVVALLAPALLFVPWSYFAGIINGEQYFYAQAFAQFFVVAALWYIASYATSQNWTYLVLIGASLAGIAAAYPYLIALPLALFVVMIVAQAVGAFEKRPGEDRVARPLTDLLSSRSVRTTLIALAVFIALLLIIALALQQGGILELRTWRIAMEGDVGEGGVANPSVETLGGPLFLLLALPGLILAWRAGPQGKTLIAFLFVWLVQLIALLAAQPWFRISGYRVDKTFYVLVFPLAILTALLFARLVEYGKRAVTDAGSPLAAIGRVPQLAAFLAVVIVLGGAIAWMRPPVSFSPLTEGELEAALWAKDHLKTTEISYLEPLPVRAYWLVFGIWREKVPNEWFQWIPAGNKMGPKSLDEWQSDAAWPQWVLVRNVTQIAALLPRVLYRSGDAAILEKDAPPISPPTPQNPSTMYFLSVFKMLGYDLSIADDALTLTTYAEALEPPEATVGWRVELLDRGRVISHATADPFGDKYPLQRWPAGRVDKRVWSLPLDPQLAPGVYDLRLVLFHRAGEDVVSAHPIESVAVNQPWYYGAPIQQVKIPPTPPKTAEMDAATPLEARFGSAFLLARYALQFDPADRVARLALYWQSLAKSETNYTVFVHVLDATGQVVVQKDAQPFDGRYPTAAWEAQEILGERYELAIPADAAGPFSIEIGMYESPSLQRLTVNGDDHVILSDVIRK